VYFFCFFQVLKHLAKDVKVYRSTASNSCGSSVTRQSPDPHSHGLSHSHHYPPSPGDGQPAEQMKQMSLEHRNSGGKEAAAGEYPPPHYSEWASPSASATASPAAASPAAPAPNRLATRLGGRLANRLPAAPSFPPDRLALSRSQPDLSRLGENKLMAADMLSFPNNRSVTKGKRK